MEVLEHNGCKVILAKQRCCGLPMLSNGEFDAARRQHAANLRTLLSWVRQGYAVVGTFDQLHSDAERGSARTARHA